ncbi:MAG: zinc-ribbon domain-containing protein [Acidimicrobiia bacterium]
MASRATVPRKPSACSGSPASSPSACTTRPWPRDSPWGPDVEPTSYRYCGVCGEPLEPGATVCGNCGAAVDPTDAVEAGIVSDTADQTVAMRPPRRPLVAQPGAQAWGVPVVAAAGAAVRRPTRAGCRAACGGSSAGSSCSPSCSSASSPRSR